MLDFFFSVWRREVGNFAERVKWGKVLLAVGILHSSDNYTLYTADYCTLHFCTPDSPDYAFLSPAFCAVLTLDSVLCVM